MMDIDKTRKAYNTYVEEQRNGYEKTARLIGYIIEEMKKANIISSKVEVSGRIKGFESVYENTKKGKEIEDCFGIRIVGKEKDLEAIKKMLNQMLIVQKEKDHRKKLDTLYNGVHVIAHMNGTHKQLIPVVEIQYWTEEVKEECMYGELAYIKYKNRNLKQVQQNLYNSSRNEYKDMPIFYEIKGENVRMLSKQETIYKMYPEIRKLEKPIKTYDSYR